MREAGRVFDVAKLRVGVRGPGRKTAGKNNPEQPGAHATILQDF
jgi:hypothetical protein